ncbi:MAG: sulfatase [Clostridia bacterium]|jgi:N-sulfoglucosamine sulfohydrolase
MNILYIHTHDSGRYLQPYGHNIATPHLMALAREGTLFRNAFCAAPTCSPSRSALLTGMAPHSCGMIGLAHRGFQLTDYSNHLVQFLKGKGYETVLCGVQHEAPRAEMIGYHRILDGQAYHMGKTEKSGEDQDIANARAVADYLSKAPGKPFFLSFGMFSTHREYPLPAEDIDPNYVLPPFPLYDCERSRKDMAAYITSARIADKCVGIVLKALEDAGLEEHTLILFTTDHGIAFPKMKCNLYDTGIGVALILKYHGNPARGKALDALVSHIDIFPTLCDLAGLEKPPWLQGVSMVPILEGEKEEIREGLYAEVTYHAAYEPMRCIRTRRYKLIRYYDEHDDFVPANIDDSPSKDFLVENGYLELTRDKEQLFDLYFDPVGRVNLVNHPRYQEVYRDLSYRLDKWMQETHDPLLKGKVEKPRGAIVNKRRCLSPRMEDYEEY